MLFSSSNTFAMLTVSTLFSHSLAAPMDKRQIPAVGGGIPITVLSVHEHEYFCWKDPVNLQHRLNCEWAYGDFVSKTNKVPCSGIFSGPPEIPCGTCVKVTCGAGGTGKSTFIRKIDTIGDRFDISLTNFKELAEVAYYEQTTAFPDLPGSGAGTAPLGTCSYTIANDDDCDAAWLKGPVTTPLPTQAP